MVIVIVMMITLAVVIVTTYYHVDWPQGQLPQVQTAKKLLYTNNTNDTNKHNHVY